MNEQKNIFKLAFLLIFLNSDIFFKILKILIMKLIQI